MHTSHTHTHTHTSDPCERGHPPQSDTQDGSVFLRLVGLFTQAFGRSFALKELVGNPALSLTGAVLKQLGYILGGDVIWHFAATPRGDPMDF